jgi:hypothetical protein
MKRMLPAALPAALVLVLPAAATAKPPVCRYNAISRVVDVRQGQPGSTVVFRNGDDIAVSGLVPCQGATVFNTDTIVIHGGGSVDHGVGIDQRPGPLAPGATPETDGASEIEVVVDMSGPAPAFLIEGTDGRDAFAAGSAGVALNDDDDVDVTSIGTTPRWKLFGNQGDDVLTLAGGFGSGVPLRSDGNVVDGGGDDDHVTGGKGDDVLVDDAGNDVVHGGAGVHDAFFGEGGNDRFVAQFTGGTDSTTLSGGRGDDSFSVAQGSPDAIDGGPGIDSATIDAGLDSVTRVENVTN